MTRRSLLALGSRLGRDGSPAARIRSAAAVVALALVVLIVLAICSVPGAAQARTERAWQRSPHPIEGVEGLELLPRRTSMPGGVATAWMVAARPGATPPPGITHVPAPGTSYVSSALKRVLASDAGEPYREAFGRIVGTVAPVGLVDRSERLAYVGIEPGALAVLPEDHYWKRPHSAFGPREPARPVVAWSWVRGVLMLLAGPLAAVVEATVRLSDHAARRQLVALRLLGMSRRELGLVRLGMVGPPVLVGMVLGVAAFAIGAQSPAGWVVAGRAWEAGDVDLTSAGVMGLVAVILVAVLAARRVVARAVDETWAGRRGRGPRRVWRWPAVVPMLAVLAFSSIYLLAPRAVIVDRFSVSAPLVVVHVVVLTSGIIGLGAAAPAFVAALADAVGRRARSGPLLVAARAAGRDPRGPARWAGLLGAVALLGSLGVAYGQAVVEGYRALDDAPPGGLVVTDVSSTEMVSELKRAGVGPVVAVAVRWARWQAEPDGLSSPLPVAVARCVDVVTVDPRLSGCTHGIGAYQVGDVPRLGPAELEIDGRKVPVPAPDGRIAQPIDGNLLRYQRRLVEPDAIDVDLAAEPPTFVAVRPTDAAARARALAIVSGDRLASIQDRASTVAAFRAERPIDDRAAAGLVVVVGLVLAIGVLLSVVDRAVAGGRTGLALMAVGASAGFRRRVVVWSSLLPLLATVPLTVAMSVAADLSWSRVVRRPPSIGLLGPSLVVATVFLSWVALELAARLLTAATRSRAWRRE